MSNKKVTKELIEEVKRMDMRLILSQAGVPHDRYNKYQCPSPNHEDTHYSSAIFKNKDDIQFLKCMSCDEVWNNISLYATLHDLDLQDDFIKIVQELDKLNNNKQEIEEKISNNPYKAKIYKIKTEEEFKKDIDFILNNENTKDFDIERKRFNKNTYVDIYLKKRYLSYDKSEDILKQSGITIKQNGYKVNDNMENSIIYYYNNQNNKVNQELGLKNQDFLIQKQINEYLDKATTIDSKVRKRNIGSSSPIWLKEGNPDKIYICEGIEDALSILMLQKDCYVITLNSTSNIDMLLKDIDEIYDKHIKDKELLLCLDNDKSGVKTRNKITEYITNKDSNKKVKNLNLGKCNDVNEYWINYCKNKGQKKAIKIEPKVEREIKIKL